MCYMCLKDDPFNVPELNNLDRARARALEIKAILKDVEGERTCNIGDATIERLKEEQRRLSRML